MDINNIVFKNIKYVNSDITTSRHIAFTVTVDYVKYAGVVLTSVLTNNVGNFTFHIFSNDFFDEDLKKFELTSFKRQCNIFCHYVDENIFRVFNDPGEFSYASYYRLFIPDYLSMYTDKFFYTDVDVCILNGIDSLFNININQYCAGVVEIQGISHRNEANRVGVKRYFASGGMLINSSMWVKNNIRMMAIEKLKSKEIFRYPDMDILNIILQDKVLFIDDKFQYQYSISNSIDTENKPCRLGVSSEVVIIHYTGAIKPWHEIAKKFNISSPFLCAVNKSEWNDLELLKPKTYKDYHKAARLAKKEGSIKEIVYCYYKYVVAKIKYVLKK